MTKTCIALALGLSVALWAQQPPKQPKAKSKKEFDTIMAIQNAPNADARIKAAEDLLHKYADTEFKEFALLMETMSYQQKNDFDNMVIAGERTLEVNPNNVMVLIALSNAIPARTRENDLDREEKLSTAEKYASRSLVAIPNLAKMNPQSTDEEWTAAKKNWMSQAHEALGKVALARKNYPVAEKEFLTSVQTTDQPEAMPLYQLGMAYAAQSKYDDAISAFEKSVAAGGVKVGGRDLAAIQKAAMEKAKAAGPPKPAAPAGQEPPPQPESKRP